MSMDIVRRGGIEATLGQGRDTPVAGDANTFENRLMYMLRPKSWYGRLNFRKSIGDMNSLGATLRELTDAIGQDAANQYVEKHRQ